MAIYLPSSIASLRKWTKILGYKAFGPHKEIWNEKLIFIHIPKAAGSSIGELGVGKTDGHFPFSFYERWLPRGRKMPFTFSVTRNPYERFISGYNYLSNSTKYAIDIEWAKRNLGEFSDVNDFAVRGLSQKSIIEWMHFRPQIDFVTGSSGDICVDFLFRLEDLEDKWPPFALKFGLPEALPVVNPSVGAKGGLSPEAVEAINKVYFDDFVRLGYEMTKQNTQR
jgi:hypothetical protein